MLDVYLLQVFNGLSVGSILLLVALGLAFSFGLMGVINMAHGELIMIGAYMPYVLQQLVGGAANDPLGLTFLVAIPVAFAVTGLIGVGMECSLIRFLYGRPLDTMLATWGVGLVLQQAARSIFGAPNVQVVSPTWLNGGLAITEGLSLPYKRLFIILLAIACVAAIWVYLTRSPPAAGYARSCRTAISPPASACRPARSTHQRSGWVPGWPAWPAAHWP